MIDSQHVLEHESTVDSKIRYTSYTWHLKQWSLLFDYYNKGVTSPKFEIADATCKCQLLFDPIGKVRLPVCRQMYVASLLVKFLSSLTCHAMLMSVSFINENQKKKKLLDHFCQNPETSIWLTIRDTVIKRAVDTQYFQNDTLVLFFEIKYIREVIQSPVRTAGFSRGDSNFADELNDLYDDKNLCDVKFVFKKTDRTLPAHKLVLAARSPVFRAMFKSDMKEVATGEVTMEDIDDTLFEIFLGYVYTGKVDFAEDVACELIAVAAKYQVLGLMNLCERYMAAHIDDTNIFSYLILAHRLSCSALEKVALEYIKQNTHVLAEASEKNLFSEFPTLIKQIFTK